MSNNEEFRNLERLAPVDAVKAWLEGDFGIDDETALISAIRKDTRITQSDDEISEFMADAMMEEVAEAQACLDRLASQR